MYLMRMEEKEEVVEEEGGHTTSLRNSCFTVHFNTAISNESEEIFQLNSNSDNTEWFTAMVINEMSMGNKQIQGEASRRTSCPKQQR